MSLAKRANMPKTSPRLFVSCASGICALENKEREGKSVHASWTSAWLLPDGKTESR